MEVIAIFKIVRLNKIILYIYEIFLFIDIFLGYLETDTWTKESEYLDYETMEL